MFESPSSRSRTTLDRSGSARNKRRLGVVLYLCLALLLGALPWILWQDLPLHQTGAANRPMLLFSAPKSPPASTIEDPTPAHLRGQEEISLTEEKGQQQQQQEKPSLPEVREAEQETIKESNPPEVVQTSEEETTQSEEPQDFADMVKSGDESNKLQEKDILEKIEGKASSLTTTAAAAAASGPPYIKLAPINNEIDLPQTRLRRERVKTAMKRAWDTYHQHAWGEDTVLPISLTATNRWGGMAMTMLDSLSTLWIMGLKDDFYQGRDWIAEHLSFDEVGSISVFETTIRALGGLLSAYDLSKEKIFLDKAKELGDLLLPAFNSPTGFPVNGLVLSNGARIGSSNACLAEYGTLQIEFRYLSHATGDPIYAQKAMHVYEQMYKDKDFASANGLFPVDYNTNNGAYGIPKYSVGGGADSFYEYLLKVWLQGNRKEAWLREMFDASVDGVEAMMIKELPSGRLYLTNSDNGYSPVRMEHLACFYPGTLALGAATLETKGDPALEARAERYMHLARELGETCYQFAGQQPSGLAPESVTFPDGDHIRADDARYLLRPEIAESMYYLHLIDGDPKWREYGAKLFEAIDTYCRTNEAYGSVRLLPNNNNKPSLRGGKKPELVWVEDEMESFFLAETLKYLYLIQETEPGEVDLAHQVFNTEAHPLHIFEDNE